jgi:hypothetical protein
MRVGYYNEEGRVRRADYTGDLAGVPMAVEKLVETCLEKGYTDLTVILAGLTPSKNDPPPPEGVDPMQRDLPAFDWVADPEAS